MALQYLLDRCTLASNVVNHQCLRSASRQLVISLPYCTQTQHIQPSVLLRSWSDGLELHVSLRDPASYLLTY